MRRRRSSRLAGCETYFLTDAIKNLQTALPLSATLGASVNWAILSARHRYNNRAAVDYLFRAGHVRGESQATSRA